MNEAEKKEKDALNNPPRKKLQYYDGKNLIIYRDNLAKAIKEKRKENPNYRYVEEDHSLTHVRPPERYSAGGDPYYIAQDNKFRPGEDFSRLEKRIKNIVLSKILYEHGENINVSKLLHVKKILGNTPENLFSLEEKGFIIKNLFPGGRFYGDETYSDYNLKNNDRFERHGERKKNVDYSLNYSEFLKILGIKDSDIHKIEGMDDFLNDKKSKMFEEKNELDKIIRVLQNIDKKFENGKFSEVDKKFAIKAIETVAKSFDGERSIILVINKDLSLSEETFGRNRRGKDKIIKIIKKMGDIKFDINYHFHNSYLGSGSFELECIPTEKLKIGLIDILDKERIIEIVKMRYEAHNNAGTICDDIIAVEIFNDKVIALERSFSRDTGSGGSGHYFHERHGFMSSRDRTDIIIRILDKNLKEIKSVKLPVENSEAKDSVKGNNRKNDIEKIISLEGNSVKVSNKEGEIFTVKLKNLKN